MTVKLAGLRQLAADLQEVKQDLETGTQKAAEILAHNLAQSIADDAPVVSGDLARSVTYDDSTVRVGDRRAYYAAWVEKKKHFVRRNLRQMRKVKKFGADIAIKAVKRQLGARR